MVIGTRDSTFVPSRATGCLFLGRSMSVTILDQKMEMKLRRSVLVFMHGSELMMGKSCRVVVEDGETMEWSK